MNFANEIVSGALKREKDRVKTDSLWMRSIKTAQLYTKRLEEAASFFDNLEELISGPKIEYVKGANVKFASSDNWPGGGKRLVVIFSVCEEPEPISAWIEEVELDGGKTGYE